MGWLNSEIIISMAVVTFSRCFCVSRLTWLRAWHKKNRIVFDRKWIP
jgi:hypothetical protein